MDKEPKYKKVNKGVLDEFVVTVTQSDYDDKTLLSKFPEFGNDPNALKAAKEYAVTYLDNPDDANIGAKFPEFDFGGTNPAEKKNGTASNGGGISSDFASTNAMLMQPLGDEKPVAVSTVAQPQVKQAQTKVKAYAGVTPDATGKDIIKGVEKKLKSGEAVDVGGSIRFEKPEEKALVENVTSLDTFAKEQGITRNQLTSTIQDFASEEFLPVEGQAIYKIDKEFEKVAKTATPEQLKKYQEDRNKAKDIVYNKFDTDIKDLNDIVTKGKLDGIDVSKEEDELRKLKAAKNNLLQTPQQAVNKILKQNPSLTRMDKLLEGKKPEEKLDTLYDALSMEYYALGKKLGYSFKDIKEGNFGLKTFMGYGDLNLGLAGDGNISGEDRKRFVELRSQMKTLAPVVLLNKQPSGKEDNVLNIFSNAFVSQLSPELAAQTQTYQQGAGVISNFLNQAQVEINPEAQAKLDKSLEDYGVAGFTAQTLGSTAGILAPAVLGGMAVGNGIRALGYSRYTAPLADFLVNTKAGQAIRAGAAYEAGGRIVPASQGEMNFGSGLVGEIATLLPTPLKKLAPALNKLFGKYGNDAARIITKGVAETGQETAQSLYQIYAETPTGQSVFDNIKQQFGEPSDILKFAISTFIMGAAMGGGADLGLHQSNVDAVNQLSPDERTVYDSFTGEQRAKANSDIIGIAKEQAPKVPTENLQKQADNTQEALTKLQSELESPDQSYSIEVDGIKYEGTSKEDLQSDIQYLTDLNGIVNEELYNRNTGQTETPPIAEADQTDVEQPKPEAGVGVGETKVKEADNFVSNLKDDEDVTITVATLDEVPAKFKDRAIESKERTADVQKSFLGIPYGKKETRTVKEKSYTYTATGKEIKDEYNSAKPLIKETPEKVKQEQPLVKQSDTANLPQDVQDKIADLRAQEQAALRNALPNYENYLTDGKVDDKKITDDADLATFNKIYDQYNAPITALFKSAKNQAQEVEVKETVSEKQVPDITVGEMLDKTGTYNGKKGKFYQDGQSVIFSVDGSNKEYELGNIAEIKDTPISDFDITHEKSVVDIGDNGNITVRGKEYTNNFSDPTAAINRDSDGNVISVNLETVDGKKRTFKGNVAEDLAYQIHLQEISKDNETQQQFEQYINDTPEVKQQIDDARLSKAAPQNAVTDNAEVQREKITLKVVAKPIVTVENTAKIPVGKAPEISAGKQVNKTTTNTQVSETTPIEKVDEKRESPKATETDLGKKQGAPKKQAIPTESIDNLVKGGTKRKAALENITEPKIADVAKALTDTKGLAKIMDILNGDDIQALNDLENSIGFKKIC